MKSHILIALLSIQATACGNPHISSTESGLERSNPPLMYEESEVDRCGSRAGIVGTRIFRSEEEFLSILKCKSFIRETFNPFEDGITLLVSNRDRETHSFDLTHQLERQTDGDKTTYLEDLFGTETFPMVIESPVTGENGLVGEDRGVDSNSVDENSKDAFIWSFSSPVTAFGLKMVGINTTSKLRLFDCHKIMIKEIMLEKSGSSFLGIATGLRDICHLSLTAKDEKTSLVVDNLIYSK